MVSHRLVLAVFCLLGVACVSDVAAAKWQISDSLPFLYNAYASYCDTTNIKSWSCGFCQHNPGSHFVGFLEDGATSVFGYVTILNNEVNVVFRGSECIYNWIDNLNFWWTPYPPVHNAYVHRGFYAAYKNVASQTRSTVAAALKQCPSCHSIRCIGHSLGGALATHAAADLSFVYHANTTAPALKLTTFGSPRVGDKVFSSWVDRQLKVSWRNTYNADPVPHLPPTLHEINWHHVATEVFEYSSPPQHYKQCNGSGEDPSCADGVLIPLNGRDHLNYMGVSLEAGKSNKCQSHGAQCNVFLDKFLDINWEHEFPGIHVAPRP